MEYTLPWAGLELTTLVVIGTDCIGSCKSNYHTIHSSQLRLIPYLHQEETKRTHPRFADCHTITTTTAPYFGKGTRFWNFAYLQGTNVNRIFIFYLTLMGFLLCQELLVVCPKISSISRLFWDEQSVVVSCSANIHCLFELKLWVSEYCWVNCLLMRWRLLLVYNVVFIVGPNRLWPTFVMDSVA